MLEERVSGTSSLMVPPRCVGMSSSSGSRNEARLASCTVTELDQCHCPLTPSTSAGARSRPQ